MSKDVYSVMGVCGVPERFRAHSSRHAALSKQSALKRDQSEFLAEANMSAKVYKLFYYQPIVGIDELAIEAAAERDGFGLRDTKASVSATLSACATAAPESTSAHEASAECEDAGTYVVRAILDRRDGVGAGPQYLVHWEGYPVEQSTWEPASHLDGARETITAFEARREASVSLRERRIAGLAPSRHPPASVQFARTLG